MTKPNERRGGRRPNSGRKPGLTPGRDARSRIAAALASAEAVELFDRARKGSLSAAEAVLTLLRSAKRLGLLPLERDLEGKLDPRGRFWLPRGRAAARAAAPDLFAPDQRSAGEKASENS